MSSIQTAHFGFVNFSIIPLCSAFFRVNDTACTNAIALRNMF